MKFAAGGVTCWPFLLGDAMSGKAIETLAETNAHLGLSNGLRWNCYRIAGALRLNVRASLYSNGNS